jgi:hypothetical protein
MKTKSNISEKVIEGDILVSKEDVLARKHFLKATTIGISISESDNLNELGYGVSHLKDAIIEIARYVLALGGKLAYGGDMRKEGFTELIFDLLANYKGNNEFSPHQRFYSYLAWPLYLQLSLTKEAELKQTVTFKRVVPPIGIDVDSNSFLKPDSPTNLYVWAKCLTHMREEMDSSCNARIFIGGRAKGFKGKMPGTLEELLIAIKGGHPIYLIGAFGGIAKDAINALDKIHSERFSNEFYFDNAYYKEMVDLYNQENPNDTINYPGYFSIIGNTGFKGLSKLNGLTEEENRRLAVTPHINEIVYLILKGFTNSFVTKHGN